MSSLSLLLFIIVAAFLAAAQAEGTASEVLWDRYQQVLMSFIKKTDDSNTYKGLQVVTEPLEANWAGEGNEKILSLLVNSASRYGSFYEPSSLQFSQQYEDFLFNLKFPEVAAGNGALQQKMWNLRTKMMEQEMKRIEAQNLCYDDYVFFKELSAAFQKMSYKHYEATECASTVGPVHRELMAINSDLVTLTTRLDGPHRPIINAISRYTTDINVGEFRETKTTLSNFLERARSNAGTPVSFSLNSQTKLSERREWIKKKKSGFIFKKKSTSIKTEVRFQDELFEMKISADSIGKIDVAPVGDWFSQSLIQSYKNNKAMWINPNKSYFGPNGTIALLPKSIYVMYNPKVTLQCSERDAYALNEMKSSSFSFGPFAKSKGSTLNIEKINEKNYRVTFDSNSDTAQIIAIDHFVFE